MRESTYRWVGIPLWDHEWITFHRKAFAALCSIVCRSSYLCRNVFTKLAYMKSSNPNCLLNCIDRTQGRLYPDTGADGSMWCSLKKQIERAAWTFTLNSPSTLATRSWKIKPKIIFKLFMTQFIIQSPLMTGKLGMANNELQNFEICFNQNFCNSKGYKRI